MTRKTTAGSLSNASSQHRHQRGREGEALVAEHLAHHGFSIVARNFACRGGEVDLIAERGDLRVFVEVKTYAKRFTPLAQRVSYTKQKKIVHAARRYNARFAHNDMSFRFDVAEVLLSSETPITYIAHAFSPEEQIYSHFV